MPKPWSLYVSKPASSTSVNDQNTSCLQRFTHILGQMMYWEQMSDFLEIRGHGDCWLIHISSNSSFITTLFMRQRADRDFYIHVCLATGLQLYY